MTKSAVQMQVVSSVPLGYRPMAELVIEGKQVEMALMDGKRVAGWLFDGAHWTQSQGGGSARVFPVGWRERRLWEGA